MRLGTQYWCNIGLVVSSVCDLVINTLSSAYKAIDNFEYKFNSDSSSSEIAEILSIFVLSILVAHRK